MLIPFIIWPSLIFLIDNISKWYIISWHSLMIQIITGWQFMIHLWYLFSILFLTIFFFILSNLFKKQLLLVLQLLAIFSYGAQYSKMYNLLDEYKNNVKMPILQTLSILPLSILGLSFASSKIVEILKQKIIIASFFSYFILVFLFKYDIFVELGGYNGIIHLFASTSFFVGFYLLPLENTNSWIRTAVKQITSYTNGIYCLHLPMIEFFVRNRFHLNGIFKFCIIIYLFSYFFSFIGMRIFGKTKLKYLFI